MVDVHEDPTTVHLTRTRAHEDALHVQAAEAPTAPVDAANIGALVDALDAPASSPTPAGQALVRETPKADAAAPSLGLRLGITAALVLVLLVAWIVQRRRAAA